MAEHGGQRLVDTHAVFTNIKTHGAETEHRNFAAQRQQHCIGKTLRSRFGQRTSHQINIIHKPVGVAVACVLRCGLLSLSVSEGDFDACQHTREKLTEDFTAIAALDRRSVG